MIFFIYKFRDLVALVVIFFATILVMLNWQKNSPLCPPASIALDMEFVQLAPEPPAELNLPTPEVNQPLPEITTEQIMEQVDVKSEAPSDVVLAKPKPKVNTKKTAKKETPKPIDIEEKTTDNTLANNQPASPSQPIEKVIPLQPVAVPTATLAQLELSYAAQVRTKLEASKRYPTNREARLTRPQGTVKLWLQLDRQGNLIDAGIEDSSGSNLLDGEALRSLRSTEFPSFPDNVFPNQNTHRFSASLKYEISSDE
ncbi:MAG: energy transducer TonB [Thiotrichales bacterium]|jgi:protein TonB|nr:energy transducer TonB [Thiotrichales bacterium]